MRIERWGEGDGKVEEAVAAKQMWQHEGYDRINVWCVG